MTLKAEQYHNEVFRQIVSVVERLARTPLSVFVCGPSKCEKPLLEKKIDIINDLRRHDVTALVGEEEVEKLKREDTKAGRVPKPDR